MQTSAEETARAEEVSVTQDNHDHVRPFLFNLACVLQNQKAAVMSVVKSSCDLSLVWFVVVDEETVMWMLITMPSY